MKYKKYRELIETTLSIFDEEDLVFIFNEYCEINNLIDDMLMTEDELYSWIETLSPTEAFDRGKYAQIYAFDEYFTFDGYANIISVSAHRHIMEHYSIDLACYILDNEQSFGYDELQELIDEYWYSEDDLSDYN